MGVISGGSGGGGGGAVILRVNGLSGTSISATLGSKTVSGTIPYAGVLELNLGKVGQWAVTARSGSYSFTQQVKAFTYGITEIWALAKKAFYNCTPTEIQAIAKSGMYKQYWSIGDYHSITLTTGEEIEVEIADFDHDETPGGVKIPLTLIMKNCLPNTYSMGTTSWQTSTLRTSGTLKSLFPSDWIGIMTAAKKLTATSSSTLSETSDLLWVPSMTELFSAPVKVWRTDEGYLYPIFTDNSSRIKTRNGAATVYMTRSNYSGNSPYYMAVNTNGIAIDSAALYTESKAVPIGFCVG